MRARFIWAQTMRCHGPAGLPAQLVRLRRVTYRQDISSTLLRSRGQLYWLVNLFQVQTEQPPQARPELTSATSDATSYAGRDRQMWTSQLSSVSRLVSQRTLSSVQSSSTSSIMSTLPIPSATSTLSLHPAAVSIRTPDKSSTPATSAASFRRATTRE